MQKLQYIYRKNNRCQLNNFISFVNFMLKDFLADCRKLTDDALDQLIPSADIAPQKLHQAIRHSIFAGGKRFRPALVLAAGKTFNAPIENLINTAAAIEMIHTYSLIHDDLPAMDDDELRRGVPTCHVAFDEATAILAGDCLQNLAFQTVADDEFLTDKTKVRLISEMGAAAGTPAGMVAGQQMDLDASGEDFTVARLEQIHRSKTGAMIRFSAVAGAIIAEASAAEIAAVGEYASRVGLLFQITDDLLDVTQTTEILGKTAGKDIAAAKATYPAFYGIAEARKLAGKIYAEAILELDKIAADTRVLRELVEYILLREA